MIDFRSKVNTMTPAYTTQLALKIQKTNIGAQKIDNSSLETYSIVIAAFQILNKLSYSWFF